MIEQVGKNHLFFIEGAEEHELYWGEAKKQTRFANYRIRKGIQYYGVLETINKPNGLYDIINNILNILWYKGYSRWNSVITHANKRTSLTDIHDAIEIMIRAGIIIIREKNKRPSKGLYFSPMEINIDPRAQKDVEDLFPNKKDNSEWGQQLINEVEKVCSTWAPLDSELANKLEILVVSGIDRLVNKRNESFPVTPKAKIKFRSVLLVIAYGRSLVSSGKTMPIRTLSSLLWQNTKILDRFKKNIVEIIGVPLAAIGISTHPETVWVYGDSTYQLEGKEPISLTCGFPTILSEQTVLKSKFKPGENLKSIVIVENLTVFQTILDKTYYQRDDVLVMWSDGYWSTTHRRILRELLKNDPFPVYIWADIDGDGLQIARHIYLWVKQHWGNPYIVLMGEREWRMSNSLRIASERDLEIVEKPEIVSLFPGVSNLIYTYRKTVEQERLLDNYEHVATQLP